MIEENFSYYDLRSILAIPLSSTICTGELTWALTNNGDYLVKIAYMIGKGGNLDNFHQAWVEIWSLDTIRKVSHFLWRLCTNSLPARALLLHYHFIEDASCPWGCAKRKQWRLTPLLDALELLKYGRHVVVGCYITKLPLCPWSVNWW